MSQVNPKFYYTETHEWINTENTSEVVVGITDHAQSLLGDVVYVDLPAVGKTVEKGAEFGVIESVKAASDLYAPISGTITAINQKLVDAPEQVNQSPYEAGWIIKIKPSHPAELEQLLDANHYEKQVAQAQTEE